MRELATLLIPAAIAVGVLAIAIVVTVILVRASRRGRRARTRALAERSRAAASLLRLDDALTDLDLDLALSGALQDPTAPAGMRRSRMTAQHARDDAYAELRAAADAGLLPVDIRRAAHQVEGSTSAALRDVAASRRAHDEWVRATADPAAVIAAARVRLAETREALGDPDALLRELAAFDASEWRDAAGAAAAATAAAAEGERQLDEAERMLAVPSQEARASLEAAERALRQSLGDVRTLEEMHRLLLEASRAVPGEFAAARTAIAEAGEARTAMKGGEVARLDAELAAGSAELDRLQHDATRRPVAAVHAIAGIRSRIDHAAGDALTMQQRVRSARTALPGTLASARASIARAEVLLRGGGDVDARMLLADAQHELAVARNANEALQALAAGRVALRDADRAIALIAPDADA